MLGFEEGVGGEGAKKVAALKASRKALEGEAAAQNKARHDVARKLQALEKANKKDVQQHAKEERDCKAAVARAAKAAKSEAVATAQKTKATEHLVAATAALEVAEAALL